MRNKRSKYQERHPEAIRPHRQIAAMTRKQEEYLAALRYSPQVVVMGPAGTGKTYMASGVAANLLLDRKIEKIVLTRPNVPSGRSLGAFPGTMYEKMAPWVVPFTDVIRDFMGEPAFNTAMKKGSIDIVPFEVMKGRTFNDSFIILDEAQNTEPKEIKMFLTRTGENSNVVINGDVKQTDLRMDSGLSTIIRLIEKQELPVPVIEFTTEDIVRSDICAMWIKAFDKEGL